jgi:hypothetical protein
MSPRGPPRCGPSLRPAHGGEEECCGEPSTVSGRGQNRETATALTRADK